MTRPVPSARTNAAADAEPSTAAASHAGILRTVENRVADQPWVPGRPLRSSRVYRHLRPPLPFRRGIAYVLASSDERDGARFATCSRKLLSEDVTCVCPSISTSTGIGTCPLRRSACRATSAAGRRARPGCPARVRSYSGSRRTSRRWSPRSVGSTRLALTSLLRRLPLIQSDGLPSTQFTIQVACWIPVSTRWHVSDVRDQRLMARIPEVDRMRREPSLEGLLRHDTVPDGTRSVSRNRPAPSSLSPTENVSVSRCEAGDAGVAVDGSSTPVETTNSTDDLERSGHIDDGRAVARASVSCPVPIRRSAAGRAPRRSRLAWPTRQRRPAFIYARAAATCPSGVVAPAVAAR